jgi:hypothetical protein
MGLQVSRGLDSQVPQEETVWTSLQRVGCGVLRIGPSEGVSGG